MLLDIQRVRFKNFYSFGAKFQEISLEEGINLVVGVDKESGKRNGAGKSSLIDAIIFGLFGKTSKDVTLPRIVNWKNKNKCEVHIDFKVGDTSYHIERGLKPAILRLFKEDQEVEQLSRNQDFQKEIEENILGINYDTFMSLIYCNPNTQISIFSAPKAQKRALLETLFGLNDFSSVSQKAHEKITALTNKIKESDNEIDLNERTIDTLKRHNMTLETQKVSYDVKEYDRVKAELEVKNKEYQEKFSDIPDISIAKFNNVKTGVDSAIRSINRKIEEPYEPILEKTSYYQGLISKSNTRLKRASDEKSILDERAVILKRELASVNGEMKALPDVSKLKDGCSCPTCLSMVSVSDVSEKLTRMRELLEQNASYINEKVTDVETKARDIEEVKENIRAELKELERRMRARKTYLYTNAIKKLEKVQVQINKAVENVNAVRKLKESIDALQKSLDILTVRKESVERENQNIKNQQTENTNTIVELEGKNTALHSDVKKYKGMRDYVEYVKFLCKDENVKQYAISNIIPYINQQANHYLSQTGFNFYLKIDSFLDVEIKGPGIHDASYGNLSSGEARTVNLAVQLALMDVCRKKSPLFPNVLLLDELLDGSIDTPGLIAMMEIVKYKQQDSNLKVFVISHRKEVNEIESSKIYQVTKSKGFSTVEEIQ